MGVAAPQIGVGLRVAVVDVTGHAKARSCHGELVLVNPEVLLAEAPVVGPGGLHERARPHRRRGPRQPRSWCGRSTADGAEQVIEADAFEARALQHELDHLDGRLFLDRVVAADRLFRRKVYR